MCMKYVFTRFGVYVLNVQMYFSFFICLKSIKLEMTAISHKNDLNAVITYVLNGVYIGR